MTTNHTFEIVNCTKHRVTLRANDGTHTQLDPCPDEPRVGVGVRLWGATVNGIPVVSKYCATINGLPDAVEGRLLLVSRMLAEAMCMERPDLVYAGGHEFNDGGVSIITALGTAYRWASEAPGLVSRVGGELWPE